MYGPRELPEARRIGSVTRHCDVQLPTTTPAAPPSPARSRRFVAFACATSTECNLPTPGLQPTGLPTTAQGNPERDTDEEQADDVLYVKVLGPLSGKFCNHCGRCATLWTDRRGEAFEVVTEPSGASRRFPPTYLPQPVS